MLLAYRKLGLGFSRARRRFESTYLRSLGLEVATILDIGVGHGTKPLYDAFEDCFFVLVDPQRRAESLLVHKPRRYAFINKGLASSAGPRLLREQAGGKTTFLERTRLTSSPILAQYEADTTTLDELLSGISFTPPIGIKIDTEGYELEILQGLHKYWASVQFVICEASIRRRFVNSYQISDLICYMKDHDFFLFNFLNLPNERPRYYDILFLRGTNALFD
jgi:FkbM family methyltransferase